MTWSVTLKRKLSRVLFLGICASLLAYGLTFEKHEVRSLATKEPKALSAMSFVSGTTSDDFMRRDGALYDVRSLLPEWASVKDCKS